MYSHKEKNVVQFPSPITATEGKIMAKGISFSYDELASVLSYDPETGKFTWLATTSGRAPAGSEAGAWATIKGNTYLVITYRGRKMSAAQVAWFLYHKVWPDRPVNYVDEDTTNLRISNLKKAAYKSIRVTDADTGVTRYRQHREQARHYGLAIFYGVTMTQYAEMFAAQGSLCAICLRPETAKIPVRKVGSVPRNIVKDLSVDHDHATGAVRQLLCSACNHMLGHAGDDASRLRAAADYIDFHRTKKREEVA